MEIIVRPLAGITLFIDSFCLSTLHIMDVLRPYCLDKSTTRTTASPSIEKVPARQLSGLLVVALPSAWTYFRYPLIRSPTSPNVPAAATLEKIAWRNSETNIAHGPSSQRSPSIVIKRRGSHPWQASITRMPMCMPQPYPASDWYSGTSSASVSPSPVASYSQKNICKAFEPVDTACKSRLPPLFLPSRLTELICRLVCN